MSRRFRAAGCGALLLVVAGCAALGGHRTATESETERSSGAKPSFLVVRGFAVPEHAVMLDPSFGFSLQRGAPGVPRAERAAAVGRAASFALGDALTRTLREAGIDAASSLTTDGLPPAGSIVVSGIFEKVDQGRRRRVGRVGPGAGESRVIADARVVAPGGRVLMTVHADSDQIPGEGGSGGTTEVHGIRIRMADVNRDARQVGAEIGRRIVAFARRSGWLMTGR